MQISFEKKIENNSEKKLPDNAEKFNADFDAGFYWIMRSFPQSDWCGL